MLDTSATSSCVPGPDPFAQGLQKASGGVLAAFASWMNEDVAWDAEGVASGLHLRNANLAATFMEGFDSGIAQARRAADLRQLRAQLDRYPVSVLFDRCFRNTQ